MLSMLAAIGKMERDLLVERTQAELARAKQEGKALGRPSRTTPAQRADMIAKHKEGVSISELSRLYGPSRANFMRIVKPASASSTPT